MEIPAENTEKGEQIKEGIFRLTEESTDHKESNNGYWEKIEDWTIKDNKYSIGEEGGDIYEFSEKIDLVTDTEEHGEEKYKGVREYSEVSAIIKNGQEILPYQVTRAIMEGRAIDDMDCRWLKVTVDHLADVYKKGLERDAKEIKSAGGKEKWIDKEAKRLCESSNWGGWGKDANKKVQIEHMKQKISSNWEEWGPQGWHEAVRQANAIMGTKERRNSKREVKDVDVTQISPAQEA